MTDRDPVQEAVERAALAWPDTLWIEHVEFGIRAALAAALAPYGGLEVVKRLEEIGINDSNIKQLTAKYAAEGIGPDDPA